MNLPGLDCGSCGFKTCNELLNVLGDKPEYIKRCIHLETSKSTKSQSCGVGCNSNCNPITFPNIDNSKWLDSLGREYDFILDHLPEDPGPREIVLPHNPMLTREMNVQVGDLMFGRPLGMSCGCPITHCGTVMAVDQKTGVMTWCITGPLAIRDNNSAKDIGYYSAEAYEGIVKESKTELKIGMRYYFKPRRCMLQWRHSGLLNYMNKIDDNTYQIRLEGLWIG